MPDYELTIEMNTGRRVQEKFLEEKESELVLEEVEFGCHRLLSSYSGRSDVNNNMLTFTEYLLAGDTIGGDF